MDIQTDIKLLSSLDDFKLTESDPEAVALAMMCGVGQNEMGAAKNILLRPVDTAAGMESSSEQGSLVAVGGEGAPADARQAEAEPLVAASSMPSSSDGLAGTDTAAGGEGDLGATETAAGGGGGADTQPPLAPAPPTTASTPAPAPAPAPVGGGVTVPPVDPGIDDTEGEATPFQSNLI